MYSVEITVEKDKVTGETRVLSSTTSLPRELLPRGIKVYEDETKGTRPPARHTPGLTPPALPRCVQGESFIALCPLPLGSTRSPGLPSPQGRASKAGQAPGAGLGSGN